MFKVYKRKIHIGQPEYSNRLESASENTVLTDNSTISKWLTVPVMIAGVVIGTLVFSVFFIAILIPLGILGIRAWLRFQKLKKGPRDQVIDAEYTVVTEYSKTHEKAD